MMTLFKTRTKIIIAYVLSIYFLKFNIKYQKLILLNNLILANYKIINFMKSLKK